MKILRHTQSRLQEPKPPALLLVSIVMSISLSPSGLKGRTHFLMWWLYWARSAFLALFCHPISIHVVVACGSEAGCVIWFKAEQEQLFLKASFRSSGLVEGSKDLQTCETQSLSRTILALTEEERQLFEPPSEINHSSDSDENTIHWFHVFNKRFKTESDTRVVVLSAHTQKTIPLTTINK